MRSNLAATIHDRGLDHIDARGQMPPMLIYKIFRPAEWAALQATGESAGAPVDLADGYVHFSTAEQVKSTLQKHFAGEGDLVLLAVDASLLGNDLRWEPARGGQLFPHLYRAIRMTDVLWNRQIPIDRDGHQPGLLE